MSTAIQPLSWDSDFMGFPVARLTLEQADAVETAQAIAECRAAGHQLIYIMVQPTDDKTNYAVRATGAWLADRKVTFATALQPEDQALPTDPGIKLTTEFTPELEALAWQSGEYSRFRLEPRLPVTVFQRLYSEWLRNSLNGSIAQAVMVMENTSGRTIGLLTLGEKASVADIGLLAVEVEARGQRVGQRLVAEARRLAFNSGYKRLQVVTQGDNIQACRFYDKCGFATFSEVNIYHLWIR